MACAATGMAMGTPSPLRRKGRKRANHRPQGRAKSNRPRVARVDSANPKDLESQGSIHNRTRTAADSAGTPIRRRDALSPNRPMTPMTAARRTLGSGLARMTKPASTSKANRGRQRRRTPTTRHSPMAAARTTATLLPETAERCVIPVVNIASVSVCGVLLVSPITRPGNSPRASRGRPDTALRSPERTARG